jgi:hypothetical protein
MPTRRRASPRRSGRRAALTDPQPSATPGANWTWNNTTPVVYTNWVSGKPDDGGGGENGSEQCAHIETGGIWDDEACNNGRPFFCSR